MMTSSDIGRDSNAKQLSRFIKTLLEIGAMEDGQAEILTSGDLSTGIGMLNALAKMNAIHFNGEWERTTSTPRRPTWELLENSTSYDANKYVVSSNNKKAYLALEECVSTTDAASGNVCYINGNAGIGKTHLLVSIQSKAKRKCRMLNIMDFELALEQALRRKERAELFNWILESDILLFDDFHYLRGNSALQRAIRYIVVTNQGRNGVIIAVELSQSNENGNIDPELWSIINCGLKYTLELPDMNERLSILNNHFGDAGIPSDAANYLAANVTGDIRRLMGAANQLITLSRQTETPITKDMARAVLPLPSDLKHRTSMPPQADSMLSDVGLNNENSDRARFFREILSNAENEEEQALALQIALGQRLRELKNQDNAEADITKMEIALSLLRDGKLEEAIRCIGT